MRYGSIPLLVSDHIYGVGLPFQCWVPWRLLALQVTEHDFLTDAGKALANVTRSLHPHAEARMRQLIAHFGRDVLWRHETYAGAVRWCGAEMENARNIRNHPHNLRRRASPGDAHVHLNR